MSKRPTIIDVAKVAGVSKATVGRVVNGQHDIVSESTRLRVIAAIDKLGYERNAVAGSLRTDRTFMIALSIPDITNPFWPEVARGVQDTIEANGYNTVTVNTDWQAEREAKYLSMVKQNRFDGLIINPIEASSTDLKQVNVPAVILGGGGRYPEFDSVGSDTEQGVTAALKHLLELGHRRIGLISGKRAGRERYRPRYETYVKFLAQHNLRIEDNLIVEQTFTDHAGFQSMQQLLSLESPPTAVFAANDVLAIGALKAAQAMQWQVPQDVSIVGMDDIYAATMTSPALTTVIKPKYQTGVIAAEHLLSRMGNGVAEHSPRGTRLHCELVVRGSTAPPRQTN